MFNSALLYDITRRYGQICDASLLQRAIKERHLEIIEMAYDLWQDSGDDVFDGYFRFFFSPGFIERDRKRAKQVVNDLWITAQSPVIRSLDAIHCYVMYHMIDAWFDDPYIQSIERCPIEIKELVTKVRVKEKEQQEQYNQSDQSIKEMQMNPADEQDDDDPFDSELIEEWFTDKDVCLGDFEYSYDEDYVDETVAEGAAEAFLSEEGIPNWIGIDIVELLDLLPTDLYQLVEKRLEDVQQEADRYAKSIWPKVEVFYNILSHPDPSLISSHQGAMDALWIFKDWVENNGGWKDIQDVPSRIKEGTIQRMIFLGAKRLLQDNNLDMSCENNIGVGQEDFKICRGNDKTVIEVKLTSNPGCKHGFEK